MRPGITYFVSLFILTILLLLPACRSTRSIDAERHNYRGEIRLIVMDDSTVYQIHSGRQTYIILDDDYLKITRIICKTLAEIPSWEVDYYNVNRFDYKKAGMISLKIMVSAILILICLS